MPFLEANPNPEFLIKSIAEQGYNLETAVADLIDNSITANANRIEILTDTTSTPFKLYLADNGDGMDYDNLLKNMRFPSQSPEQIRALGDLGRFGLGLKTASFSQTRKFTVISRKKGSEEFYGATWDVDHLKSAERWEIIINSDEEILEYLKKYQHVSDNHLENSTAFIPNTIIIWQGLYKFENYLEETNKKDAFNDEITNSTSGYLSIVFHRFIEKINNPLTVRINNTIVKPFNPFREDPKLRTLQANEIRIGKNIIKSQGFVLPNSSIKESKNNNSKWTPNNKSLIDMEGIYIYRANRLILFGGWNNLIKKSPRMQLGRLRVEIGNKVDHFFHLNVAKSQINIPHDLKKYFLRSIAELKTEAQREYYNHILISIPTNPIEFKSELFYKDATNRGVLLKFNTEFPLLKSLKSSLDDKQMSELNFILKMTTNLINKVRQVDNVQITGNSETDGISIHEIVKSINELLKLGLNKEQIKRDILPNLGFKNNIPEEITSILN